MRSWEISEEYGIDLLKNPQPDSQRAMSLSFLCGLFGYTRQAYYKHLRRNREGSLPTPFFWAIGLLPKRMPRLGGRKRGICCNKTDFRSVGIGYLRCFRKTIFWSNVTALRPARGTGCVKISESDPGFRPRAAASFMGRNITYISLKGGFAYLAGCLFQTDRRLSNTTLTRRR